MSFYRLKQQSEIYNQVKLLEDFMNEHKLSITTDCNGTIIIGKEIFNNKKIFFKCLTTDETSDSENVFPPFSQYNLFLCNENGALIEKK